MLQERSSTGLGTRLDTSRDAIAPAFAKHSTRTAAFGMKSTRSGNLCERHFVRIYRAHELVFERERTCTSTTSGSASPRTAALRTRSSSSSPVSASRTTTRRAASSDGTSSRPRRRKPSASTSRFIFSPRSRDKSERTSQWRPSTHGSRVHLGPPKANTPTTTAAQRAMLTTRAFTFFRARGMARASTKSSSTTFLRSSCATTSPSSAATTTPTSVIRCSIRAFLFRSSRMAAVNTSRGKTSPESTGRFSVAPTARRSASRSTSPASLAR